MKTAFFAVAALAFAPVTLAAPPAAPVVTVGAHSIKRLQFDWPSVPGVGRYELRFRAAPGAQWVKYAETIAQRPIIRITVSVHLSDLARRALPGGRLQSVRLHQQRRGTRQRDRARRRGISQAELCRRRQMVRPGRCHERGRLHRRRHCSIGRQQRRQRHRLPVSQDQFVGALASRIATHTEPVSASSSQPFSASTSLAVNGDGSLVAFGRYTEGIGGQSANGAVYLFRRNGTTWSQEKRLAGGGANDRFGNAVDLDDSGNTLSVRCCADTAAGSRVSPRSTTAPAPVGSRRRPFPCLCPLSASRIVKLTTR